MIDIENNDNLLPWARGNPQPSSGKRGSLSWTLATSASSSFNVCF